MAAKEQGHGRAFCPGCGQKYAVPEQELSQRPGLRFRATCKSCNTAFSVFWEEDGLKTEADEVLAAKEPDSRDVLSTGARVGKYEIEELVATGGSSAVYRAFEMGANRTVALKVLHRPPDSDFGVRFRREVEVQGNLKHPNMMPIFDQGSVDGKPYYSMELLHKPITLEEVVSLLKQGRLTYTPSLRGLSSRESILRHVLLPVARAIHFANANGIIHRDLKPGNVILDARTLHVYVIDFGICHLFKKAGRRLVLRAGETPVPDKDPAKMAMGTTRFMPPEQAQGEISERGDVWALGALLYFVLSGEYPIAPAINLEKVGIEKRVANLRKIARSCREAGDELEARFYERSIEQLTSGSMRTTRDMLRDAQEANYTPLPDGTEPALAAIAMRAMAPKAEERYESAENFARDLQRQLDGRPVHAYVNKLGAGKASIYKGRLFAQRNRTALIAAGVVLGLAAIVVVLQSISSASEEEEQVGAWMREARGTANPGVQEDRMTKVLVLRPGHEEASRLLKLARKFDPLLDQVRKADKLRDKVKILLRDAKTRKEAARYVEPMEDMAAVLEGSVLPGLRSLPKNYPGRALEAQAIQLAGFMRGRRPVGLVRMPRGIEVAPVSPRSRTDLELAWDEIKPWGVTPLAVTGRSLESGTYAMRFKRPGTSRTVFLPFVISHLSPPSVELGCPIDPDEVPQGMVYVGGVRNMQYGDLRFHDRTRRVDLEAFFLDRHEVTNADYAIYLNALSRSRRLFAVPRRPLPGSGNRTTPLWTERPDGTWIHPDGAATQPVTGISFLNATDYARHVGKRLPTAAEWEHAARGVDGRDFPFGSTLDPLACNVQTGVLAKVEEHPRDRSPYGAYDMGGNVAEWVENGGGEQAMVKGGSFELPRYRAIATTFGKRKADLPYSDVGFRCARDLE
ncbi:MAG: SUMF1/EgtB/PvdO family nonheme iron enzyme [Planctomycetota bacterium]|jgi:serine/threonine protein kinase